MMRTHEELLTFASLEEMWKEIVGGIETNENDIKFFSGHHENAIKDVNKWKKKMKHLRRKQETTFGVLNGRVLLYRNSYDCHSV